jgi:hypothetical protein
MTLGAPPAMRPPFFATMLTIVMVVACSPPPLAATPSPSQPSATTALAASPLSITPATPITPSVVVSPAASLVPAASPASSPRAEVSSEPTSSSAAACDHPFYPISASATWRYLVTGTAPSSMVETRRPTSGSTFTVRDVFPDSSLELEWRCEAEGLVASQLPRLSTGQSPLRFAATAVRGVTIPTADHWVVGSTWTTEYDVRSAGEGGAGGTVIIESIIDGPERLSVPAGDFQTLRVAQHIVMDLHIETRGLNLPMTMTFATTQWYARDVGLVRSAASGELGDTVSELSEITP